MIYYRIESLSSLPLLILCLYRDDLL